MKPLNGKCDFVRCFCLVHVLFVNRIRILLVFLNFRCGKEDGIMSMQKKRSRRDGEKKYETIANSNGEYWVRRKNKTQRLQAIAPLIIFRLLIVAN